MYRMQIDPQARTITQLTQARNFKAADVVLISTNFREDTIRNDIKALPGFVDIVESMGKTVVLTSNSPQFINYGSDTVFDRLLKTHQGTVTSSSIDSIYFKALNESVAKINTRLSLFADRRNLSSHISSSTIKLLLRCRNEVAKLTRPNLRKDFRPSAARHFAALYE